MDYNARFYSPTLGRFTQPDSIIPDATNSQSWNRYSYVYNSPINFSDPTGHDAISTCGGNSACMGWTNQHPENIDTISNFLKLHKDDESRKPGEPVCKGEYCKELEDLLTYTSVGADSISWVISLGEAVVADFAYGVATVGCVASEGIGCGPLFASAWLTDKAAAVFGGFLENWLGVLSTAATVTNDILQGNFGYDKNIGPYIGKDSIVSIRNTALGFFPNSNLDLAISTSQLKYDRDRFLNNFPGGNGKPGGYVPLFSVKFLSQLIIKDWW